MFQTRDVIFDELMIFNDDIEAVRLEFKKTQIAQNMNLDQLAELLQQLNDTETTRQFKSDRLNLDDDTVMPESDNTDSDDHNSHDSDKNQL